MLEIQKYLNSQSPDKLAEEFGIRVYEHPDHPLLGFKYHQIDSPKTHPLVRECRGIVLEKDTWRLVAKPFHRFFNVGENQEEFARFDWTQFVAQSKEDGSLIIVYNYDNKWHVNTSGSFGLQILDCYAGNWQDLFWNALGTTDKVFEGHEDKTFIFELCTPYNKIVRQYRRPAAYLLSAFVTEDFGFHELCWSEADQLAAKLDFLRPECFNFWNSQTNDPHEELKNFLYKKEEEDPSYEGLVLRDVNGLRFKWKTSTYVSMHHMKDNGNILLPKNLVPVVLSGEIAEVIAVMPEVTTAMSQVEEKLNQVIDQTYSLWEAHKNETDQKTFALAIKNDPFKGYLFTLRKLKGSSATRKDLWNLFRDNSEKVSKIVFGKQAFEFDILT